MVEVLDKVSYEEFLKLELQENQRAELIFGKVYLMAGASANHQDMVGNIFFYIKQRLKEQVDSKCKVRVAPFDVKFKCKKEINVVQPDVMIFCKESQKPCAIFEVLSPSTSKKDITVKKELYECAKIEEYFLVSDMKIVEKFELKNGKYQFMGHFCLGESLELKCVDEKMMIDDIFEGIDDL
jgi:Uma2 family endonuclease